MYDKGRYHTLAADPDQYHVTRKFIFKRSFPLQLIVSAVSEFHTLFFIRFRMRNLRLRRANFFFLCSCQRVE